MIADISPVGCPNQASVVCLCLRNAVCNSSATDQSRPLHPREIESQGIGSDLVAALGRKATGCSAEMELMGGLQNTNKDSTSRQTSLIRRAGDPMHSLASGSAATPATLASSNL